MAHFAKLDNDNRVVQVLVVNNEDILDADGNESEEVGIKFLEGIFKYPKWKQTSYNGKFRGHYAGVGFTYDPVRDKFIPPKPYPSWIFDETTGLWKSPVPLPADGVERKWDEDSRSWKTLEEFL